MSTVNYNDWFYKYHKYLTGVRNGSRTYNDTKWQNINDRYTKLIDDVSSLLDEQPYNVIGNYTGYQQYFDLMTRSNYTFEDIDQALIETYKMTLQNAMGNMMVNTHAIIAKYKYNDKRHVSHDAYGHYYIIDVPFAQMHFGERDEFVRQKLHAFYETESRYFMPSDRFLSDEISRILGFTIICCTNGFMSDDWYVGISEQGFRFKIGWRYSADVEFLIMKLDESCVFDRNVDTSKITPERVLTYADLNIEPGRVMGNNCIVQISDSVVRKSVTIAPNFGYFTQDGLQIPNMQKKTIDDLINYKSSTAKIRIYVVKYLREVPGIFPAVNYYDMMSAKPVYTESYNHVVDGSDKQVILQDEHVDVTLPICTPPISLSHVAQDDNRHSVIYECYHIQDDLEYIGSRIHRLGAMANNPSSNPMNVLDFANQTYNEFYQIYLKYAAAAMMTALIPLEYVSLFQEQLDLLKALRNAEPNYQSIQEHTFDLLYGDNFDLFVRKIYEPLKRPPFTTFGNIEFPDYFPNEPVCVNRPVSEQCFIPLRYKTDEGYTCWIFDLPDIKHFHGIDNIFYIDSDLTGDELFKFMYLYTDTENPSEKVMIPISDDALLDFDLFTKEVDKHMGYVRYWDVSNKLMKLTHMFYRNRDQISELAIITKIMKHKLDGDVFLDYASKVNYELSNVTSDNIKNYTETSMRAPFTINFLFYTLSMFYGNRNRLQSYLLHMITEKEFYPRYADLKISDMGLNLLTENVNYSVISYSPTSIQHSGAILPDTSDLKIFNGLQFPMKPSQYQKIDPTGNIIRYPFVFNVYESEKPYYMLEREGVSSEYYIEYNDIDQDMFEIPRTTYYDDAQLASMVSVFLAEVYDGINELTTNYRSTWNPDTVIASMEYMIRKRTSDIRSYIIQRGSSMQCHSSYAANVIEQFRSPYESNPVYHALQTLKMAIWSTRGDLSNANIFDDTQKLLTMMRKIHECSGFDRYAIRNIRKLYIHLKQIQQQMSLYQFKCWLDDTDMTTVANLVSYLSDNPNIPYQPTAIQNMVDKFTTTINVAKEHVTTIQPAIDVFLNELQSTYLDTLITFCDDVIQNYIFDFYVMNKIAFTQSINGEPAYAEIRISSDDPHVAWDIQPNPGQTYAMMAQVKYDHGTSFIIREIIPTCENAFLSGEDTTVSITFFDKNGNLISTFTDIPVTFTKVGLSSDIRLNSTRYMNGQTIALDTQNVHETFNVDDDDIINVRHADLHYELLCGNRFTPIDHFSEYCVPNIDELQGPSDKLYLSCEQINRLAIVDEANRPTQTMHFRACDVYHIEPIDGVITSIGGKYFEGQTIYAVTDDGLSLFPMVITAIDHGLERGFIEAKVDTQHTKWFETTDANVMQKYLTTDIDCTVIDDNIRNFLDEFSEYDGATYIIPDLRKSQTGMVELPGDPMYVQSNSDYVYTRLAWMFHEDVPNRFNLDEDVRHHFVYIGSGEVVTEENMIYINMINHNFNNYTYPELYRILRTEPDDHSIWDKEREVFQANIQTSKEQQAIFNTLWWQLRYEMTQAETIAEKQKIKLQIEDCGNKIKYWKDFETRMNEYLVQLETPTTWYNVRAYDDALVYINNGRAHLSRTFIPHIQDLPYSDQIQVLLFDWDAKEWINPAMYTITTETEDDISIDPSCSSNTDNVLTKMTITFLDTSYRSKRILIYYAYETSDVFDDITLHDMHCLVRFQPVLSVYKERDTKNLYDNIRIRKHYDENEKYMVQSLETLPESFGEVDGYIFHRPSRSGLYTTGSPIRFGDLTLVTNNVTYTYEDFDIYIENPIKDNHVPQTKVDTTYTVSEIHATEHYEIGHQIVLISVNNDDASTFGQTASSVLFTGVTTDEGILITQSFLTTNQNHQYTCTILPSKEHPMIGGVYRVTVTTTEQTNPDVGDWILLEDETSDGISTLAYRLIPDTVALVLHENVTIDTSSYIALQNHYALDTSHTVESNNSGHDDLYTYYYDKEHDVRYPVGDVLINQSQKRLTIDLSVNTNVESIRSNAIGICRYATQKIPQDGIIDLTGLIPTPLTRDRYEFWVNGRYVTDPAQIIILSPTTFQLRNMTSLKNLDVVELVDDITVNAVNRLGPIYIDLNGQVHTSYLEILRNRVDVVDQKLTYIFNQDIHSGLDNYLYDSIRESHNHDYETDIMELIQTDAITSYNQLHNIPTLNGISIFHLTTADLGLQEIPNQQILHAFDKVWKLEGLTGVTPFKHMSAYVDTLGPSQTLHVKRIADGFEVYTTGLSDTCFTLYISTNRVAGIDDVTKTLQIIPMIRPGTRVIIDESFAGNWLRSTVPGTAPIKIQ